MATGNHAALHFIFCRGDCCHNDKPFCGSASARPKPAPKLLLAGGRARELDLAVTLSGQAWSTLRLQTTRKSDPRLGLVDLYRSTCSLDWPATAAISQVLPARLAAATDSCALCLYNRRWISWQRFSLSSKARQCMVCA
jgi:hypothetical protein